MSDLFDWDDKYLTGVEELDNYHKKIFKLINELLIMYEDTKTNKDQIFLKDKELTSLMIEHFDIESRLLKKNDIPNYLNHAESHKNFKDKFLQLKNHDLPTIINSFMTKDICIEYFLEHFPIYDKIDLPILHQKLLEENIT